MQVPVTFSGGWSLVNGHHRYFAARDLGWTRIPAELFDHKPVPAIPGWDAPALAEAI